MISLIFIQHKRGHTMSDETENEGGVIGPIIMLIGIIVICLMLFGPALMGIYNSFAYPGYETCKREIRRSLRDPGSADFELRSARQRDTTDPNVWRYTIMVRATNGFGDKTQDFIGCTVDDRGPSTRYYFD